ncbi:MAG: hypothetical protein ACYTG0_46970 [Planctomycetota bacterium]|jgi:hypothetical protein
MLDDGKVNRLVLVKGRERYIFHWTDANRAEMLRRAADYVANEQEWRSFNQYDLDVLKQMSKPAVISMPL